MDMHIGDELHVMVNLKISNPHMALRLICGNFDGLSENALLYVLAKDAGCSYDYALYTKQKKRFKRIDAIERSIATDPEYSLNYALDILEDRFEIGECIMRKSKWHWMIYSQLMDEK